MPPAPDLSATNDAALMLSMAAGDAASLASLYDRYADKLFGLALRVTREHADAEEVVVDTFAQVWRDAKRFDPRRGSVAAWLATIARSRALDLLRARARHGRLADAAEQEPTLEPGLGGPPASPMADLLADEESRAVQAALGQLPEAQRTALQLAYFEGLSQTEIAERTNEPLGTVKTRVRLGLRKMRELVGALGPGSNR